MKAQRRKNIGRFIVADPAICRGKPTFKGTRVTVRDVLSDVARGLAWEFICYRWGDSKITKEAIRWISATFVRERVRRRKANV